MKSSIIAAALFGIALTNGAQAKDARISGNPDAVIFGTCDPKSGVRFNHGKDSPYGCDSVAISRIGEGSFIIVMFTDTSGDDERTLAFSGFISGKHGFGAVPVQMVAVEQIYLGAESKPIPTSRGECALNWSGLQRTGGHLTSVACGAAGTYKKDIFEARAGLKAE